MPSLVELLFEARGTEQAAAAVAQVSARMKELQQQLGIAKTFGTDNEVAQARQAVQLQRVAEGTKSLTTATREQVAGQVSLSASLGETISSFALFGAAALAARKIYDDLKSSIGEGADFARMALRTGESVRDLVVEEQAFKNAGLGAHYLGAAINLLERAISPLAPSAKRNAEIFREMGLSMPEFRVLSFSQQLKALSEGLGRLPNQSARAEAALQLFGRYAGGQMLQLLGDPAALALAEQQAGALGEKIEQNAQASLDLAKAWNGVTANFRTLGQEAATQLMPTLQNIVDLLGQIHLGPLGAAAGLGGVGALATGGAFLAVDSIAGALTKRLATMEAGVSKSIIRGATYAMQDVAAWTPLALGTLVAAQIVIGVVEAWQSSQIQAIFAEARNQRENRQKFESGSGATDQGEWQQNLVKATEDFRDLLARRDALATPHRVQSMDGQGNSITKVGITSAEQEQLDSLNRQVTNFAATMRNKLLDPMAAAHQMAANAIEKFHQSVAALVTQLPQLRAAADKNALAQMDPAHRIMTLQSRRSGLETQLQGGPAAGAKPEDAEAWRLDLEKQIAALKKEEAVAAKESAELVKQRAEDEKKVADELQRQQIYALETRMEQAKAAGNEALAQKLKEEIELKRASVALSGVDLDLAKQRVTAEHQIWAVQQAQKAAKDAVTAERTALDSALNQVRENLATLQGDYTRTDAAKWADRKKAIQEEIATLKASIAADQLAAQNARASGNAGAAATFEQSAHQTGGKLASAQGDLAKMGPDPTNWIQQTQKGLVGLQNQLGTTAEQIAHKIVSTIGTAFISVSQHITSAVVGTERWRQAIGQIGLSIEESIVGAIVDMATRWVENLAIMAAKWIATKLGLAAADKGIALANVAALVPIATATSLVWAAPAAMATIATYGGAAAAAPGEIALAMMGTSMLALSGASEGGYFPGDPSKVRGVFHGDEVIFSAPAVRNLGAENLLALHRAGLTGSGRQAAAANGGGTVSGAGGASARESARNTHLYLDPRMFARAMQEHMNDNFRVIAQQEIRAAMG